MIPSDWLAVLAVLGPDLPPMEWRRRIALEEGHHVPTSLILDAVDYPSTVPLQWVADVVRVTDWPTADDVAHRLGVTRAAVLPALDTLTVAGVLTRTTSGQYAPALETP